MAYENLCMYCFEDMQGQTTCPHCGRDSRAAVPQVQMLPGSLVYHSRFLIGRALGQDATGIVYAAFDTKKENKLRIREYLPRDCAERLNDGAVVPMAGKEDEFENGIKRLRASVESVDDPRKRHFFFEENGTAYIAQRKSAAAAAQEEEAREEEESGSGRRIGLWIGIAASVVVVVAALLITIGPKLFDGPRDIAQNPTLDPNQVWIPATTPTATPYVTPTFAALVDPELSWMDYTYDGDVEQEYQQAERESSTPTPAPTATLASGANKYGYINGNSSRAEITKLQQKLADLGWLADDQISGRYDSATVRAVKEFQSYVNQRYKPAQQLTVDGSAGPKTQQWLYEVAPTRPTPSPTPRVTPAPDTQTVDQNSPADRVRDVQQMLVTLGLLPEGSADGKYGATTQRAVQRFQQRVNQLQGYDVLEESGKVDPQSMAFLRYYAEEWERLRQATAQPTATPKPTAQPTPTPTTRPVETISGVIDANSTPEQIRKVQQLLIDIGMLPAGSADGKYGSATIGAVADFQQWVNMQRQEQTLPVNGEVDQLTLAYLQYCKDHGLNPYGTPRPTAAVTVAPTAAPTSAPTEAPTPDDELEGNDEITIDAHSDPESIRYVQQMLVAVGAMDASGVDGVYGGGTTRAVLAFQEWVNRTRGAGTLPENGQVDNATRLALEYAYDHDMTMTEPTAAPTEAPTAAPTEAPTQAPTAAPTEAPTEAPTPEPEQEGGEITVGEDSDPESIRYVQQMLNQVGALSGNENGVYDEATVEAVKRFQEWVNSIQGSNTLPVTGQVDDRTRQALEYAVDNGFTMSDATPEPEEIGVGAVGDIEIRFGGVTAGDDIVSVEEGVFDVVWRADGDVEGYYVYVIDGSGDYIVSVEDVDDTSFTVQTELMNPGEIYTLRLGVLPARGELSDIVWRETRFTLPQRETPAPEPEPTEEPTPAPTEAPVVGQVSTPEITVAGAPGGGSPVVIEEETFQVNWRADGDVDRYRVRVTDEQGGEIVNQETTETSATLRASSMEEGVVYTLTVGAIPVNGTDADMVVASASFTRPLAPTPEPEPESTVAAIGKPVINLGGTAVQHDGVPYMTDSSIIISWNADGNVAGYSAYVENQSGEQHELSSGTATSCTVSTASLPAGIYTVYVGALPENGGEADVVWNSTRFGIPSPTAEPTVAPEEPTPQPTQAITGPVSAESDTETIQQLQMRLYSLGLLSVDAEPGVLDEITLQAVYDFQVKVNEIYALGLTEIDPTDPATVIDAATVQAIFTDLSQP